VPIGGLEIYRARYLGDVAVAGYDVALTLAAGDVSGVWMAASGNPIPNPNQLRW
jgi:hypothetical protein